MTRPLAAILLLATACAQADNLAFKHYTLGMPYSLLQAMSELDCKEIKEPIADQMCTLKPYRNETIGGAPVKALMLLVYDGQLATISVQIAERDFRQVAIALQTKFGPGNITENVLQNRMGAKFDNTRVTWSIDDQRIEAEQRSGRIDRSSIIFTRKNAEQGYKARIPAGRATNAGDL